MKRKTPVKPRAKSTAPVPAPVATPEDPHDPPAVEDRQMPDLELAEELHRLRDRVGGTY